MSDSLKQMTEAVQKFCEDRDWDQFHTPKELAIGLVTEGAELLDEFRFLSSEQIKEKMSRAESLQSVEEEVADVLFFLLRFAQMNKIDLPTVLGDKIAKNAEKYPVDKARSNNQKYNQF